MPEGYQKVTDQEPLSALAPRDAYRAMFLWVKSGSGKISARVRFQCVSGLRAAKNLAKACFGVSACSLRLRHRRADHDRPAWAALERQGLVDGCARWCRGHCIR